MLSPSKWKRFFSPRSAHAADPNAPALISLTFDDGLRCHFERALPILDRHGLVATFFLVANTDPIFSDGFPHPDWSKTDWNGDDIRLFMDMMRRGHEIGAHSVHHKHPFLDDNPEFEAVESKRFIEERLNTTVSSYCYPFCHYTRPIGKAVRKAGFTQARWGAHDSYYPLGSSLDDFKVDCRHIGKLSSEAVNGHSVGKDGCEDVGSWLRPGLLHILMYHGIGGIDEGWWPISVAEFEREMAELAKYRDAGRVEVVTFVAAMQRLRGASRE